ncbi:MAG: SIS domain-containing protein [Verrucomicrobiales bacterium]
MTEAKGMNGIERYYQTLLNQFEQIKTTQWDKIKQAGAWLGESLANEGWLYAFGTGHSHMLAEEIFYRAGNPARATPILDEKLMLHENAIEATYIEREPGYGREILKRYPVKKGDVLVVISNSGRNAVPIDLALAGREQGLKVIAITNLTQSMAWPSRHASGKRLAEVAELTIDNCGVNGDSALEVEGLPGAIGPTTTSTGALIMNAIIVEGIERSLLAGKTAEIFISSNTNGDDHNNKLLQKYRHLNPHL